MKLRVRPACRAVNCERRVGRFLGSVGSGMIETALQILVSLVVTVVGVGAFPFAMKVTSRLAAIEKTLENMHWQEAAISDLRESLHEVKTRVAVLESQRGGGMGGAK